MCELFGRDSSCFEDARIPHELLCRGGARRVDIRHRLRGRFDGGLARTLGAGASDDAVLSGAKADDRGGRDSERKHEDQNGLAAFVAHGVHSTRRAAAPSTIKRGRPTNPSGTGIA